MGVCEGVRVEGLVCCSVFCIFARHQRGGFVVADKKVYDEGARVAGGLGCSVFV